jgi:hypothetical protein
MDENVSEAGNEDDGLATLTGGTIGLQAKLRELRERLRHLVHH